MSQPQPIIYSECPPRALRKFWKLSRKQAKMQEENAMKRNTNLYNTFPDLILFITNINCNKPLNILFKSFEESYYGPIDVRFDRNGPMWYAKVFCGDTFLGEGNSFIKDEAESMAAAHALKLLQKTHYTVEEKQTYLPDESFPHFLQNVDSSHLDIFKVVCLRKPGGPEFPHPLTGAILYVYNKEDLWNYIDDHVHRQDKADLFIFNIEEQDHHIVIDICRRTNMLYLTLSACSNRGMMVRKKENIKEIFDELKRFGHNIKYHLIPPGSNSNTNDKEEDSGNKKQPEEIKICPSIADNLILLELFSTMNDLEDASVIISMSVKNCPHLEDFTIEKKTGTYGEVTSAEALIDRKLVGRALGTNVKVITKEAAQNALDNLKKVCYYIEAKPSYHGIGRVLPEFLARQDRIKSTNTYKIVESTSINNLSELNQLLREFRSTQLEDLFFLGDFSYEERYQIHLMAKNLGYSVRQFGNDYVCVNKRKTPNTVFRELMATDLRENEKYKLIIPPAKLSKQSEEISQIPENNYQPMRQSPNYYLSASKVVDTSVNDKRFSETKPDDNYKSDTYIESSCKHKEKVGQTLDVMEDVWLDGDEDVDTMNEFNKSTKLRKARQGVQLQRIEENPDYHEKQTTEAERHKKLSCETAQQESFLYRERENVTYNQFDRGEDLRGSNQRVQQPYITADISYSYNRESLDRQEYQGRSKQTTEGERHKKLSCETAQQKSHLYRERKNDTYNQFDRGEDLRDSNQKVQQPHRTADVGYSYHRETLDRQDNQRRSKQYIEDERHKKLSGETAQQESFLYRERENVTYNQFDRGEDLRDSNRIVQLPYKTSDISYSYNRKSLDRQDHRGRSKQTTEAERHKTLSCKTAQQESFLYRERNNVTYKKCDRDDDIRDSYQRVQQPYRTADISYSYNRESLDRQDNQGRSTYENEHNKNMKRSWEKTYGPEQSRWREKEKVSYNSIQKQFDQKSEEPMNKMSRLFNRSQPESRESDQRITQSHNLQKEGGSAQRSGYNFTERQLNFREFEHDLYKRDYLETYKDTCSKTITSIFDVKPDYYQERGLWSSNSKNLFGQQRY